MVGARVAWMTSKSAVVTVDSSGMMVAQAPGTAQVIATRDGAIAIVTITVTGKSDSVAAVTPPVRDTVPSTLPRTVLPRLTASIALEAPQLTLVVGDSQLLRARALDSLRSPIDGRLIAWTSEDASVARVFAPGRVVALKSGATTLRASADGKTATLALTVRARAAPPPAVVQPPEPTIETRRVQGLAAGGSLTCAALSGGQATCWGGGQPGPVTVAGVALEHVTAGEAHACGLTRAAEAYCWGANSHGQLGNGSTIDAPTPMPVKIAKRFSRLSAGASHTCGIAADGAAYCWGGNGSGQLGDGTHETRTGPSVVGGGVAFSEIAAGGAHTCALTTAGKIYCWGDGASGQLGNKAQTGSTEPVALETSSSFKVITAGSRHTCALTVAGKAFCWGENASGQLGDESHDNRSWPQPVVLTEAFRAIEAGGAHTCGILASGGLVCWGENSNGQLGTAPARPGYGPLR